MNNVHDDGDDDDGEFNQIQAPMMIAMMMTILMVFSLMIMMMTLNTKLSETPVVNSQGLPERESRITVAN